MTIYQKLQFFKNKIFSKIFFSKIKFFGNESFASHHLFSMEVKCIFLEVAKIRNRRQLVVGNTLNVLSRNHDNCEPPDLEVNCGENERCGKWSCQMLRDKLLVSKIIFDMLC